MKESLTKSVAHLLLLFFFLLCPTSVFAGNIVLNEIFPNPVNESDEYIELFNTTSSEVSLSGWIVADKVKTYTISGNIQANGFLVINKSISGLELNNSNEEITLKDSSNNLIDSFSYADTIEGRSWSRYPDGTGSFVNNTDTTSASQNSSAPTPTPTVTPTPTNTPTPTKTPTPTPTNKPTPTPTKTPTPTPTPTTSILITNTPTPQKKNTPTPTKKLISHNTSLKITISPKGEVKGAEVEEEDDLMVKSSTGSFFSWTFFVLFGLGVVTLACGILLYREWKKQKELEI